MFTGFAKPFLTQPRPGITHLAPSRNDELMEAGIVMEFCMRDLGVNTPSEVRTKLRELTAAMQELRDSYAIAEGI